MRIIGIIRWGLISKHSYHEVWDNEMRVGIIGTGYVGLVTGVCLAFKGHQVTCFDIQSDIVDTLNCGRPHIHETGLGELLEQVLSAGRFQARLAMGENFPDLDLILLAVGTPSQEGRIDLSYIRSACQLVGPALRVWVRQASVVVKSTVLPGTTDTIVRAEIEQASGLSWSAGHFGLGMNPEFLREGNAVEDFLMADRIVLGHEDATSLTQLQELYAPWDCAKLVVNTRTAEMIKYANNALLALQISAVNELANIAAAQGGIDAAQVLAGVHLDRRWNPTLPNGQRVAPGILSYLWPGCGFGGSCFPKDVQALRSHAQSLKVKPRILQAILDVNHDQPSQVTWLLSKALRKLADKKIVVLGLAFKPDTDDVRESASLKIVADLAAKGALVQAHDPMATANARRALDKTPVTWIDDWPVAVQEADAVVVATKWGEYQSLPDLMKPGQIIVDPRRMFHAADFAKITYLSIGKGIS
jgi:UDPglucose 6-dehydrogenase